MKLVQIPGGWAALTEFSEKDIPKEAGFRWNPAQRRWETKEIERAMKLVAYADEHAAGLLLGALQKREAAVEASKATDANMSVPSPAGLDYMPFQKAGIAYAQARANVLIADEMGLGKTIQAIGVINSDETIKRVLVICPASLKINWKRELEKWLVRPLTVEIMNEVGPISDVWVVNYDILRKHHEALRGVTWDLIVIDECHYLKNPKAQRTAEVLGKWDKDPDKIISAIPARRRVFMTGTPVVNRPIELWPLLHALDKDNLGKSWKYYVTRYCDGHETRYGWDVSGASNLGELQEKLRATLMVRRLKKDVLTELPAKVRQVVELPANGCIALLKREQAVVEDYEVKTEEWRLAVELSKASDNPEDYQEAVESLRRGASVAFEEISKARHQTAVAKVPMAIEFLKDIMETGQKVVIFAHHHDVINALYEQIGRTSAVVLTGQTPQAERQAAVDRFQKDPGCLVFIGSIGAAGVGITLTASSHVVFVELDWVPGNVSQAEDRCHRIGQTNSVLVQHLVLDGSLDVRMAEILIEKQRIIDQALDAELEKVLIMPVREEAATATASQSRIAKEAEKLTDDQVVAIHGALRVVAGMCDGALALDGMGFNKLDTRLGKSLAANEMLTRKQAALGKILVIKYQKQISGELLARVKGAGDV